MNEEIINKLIDYSIPSLDDTTLLIQHYGGMIEYYRKMVNITKNNKPLPFQKKKLIMYYKELDEYNKKIEYAKLNLEKEINLIKDI